MNQIVISANDLTKTFSGKEVVRNCTFSVEHGSIYGFLGRTEQVRLRCSNCCWGY